MSEWQFWFAVIFVPTVLAAVVYLKQRDAERAEVIRAYTFPYGLFEKLKTTYPGLTHKDCQLVGQALRQFFLVYLKGGRRPVSMPSRVVDALWHEFILHTRSYRSFCERAFGDFLHHAPAAALDPWEKKRNEGLRRAWWHACRDENVDPRRPTRLPLLFAIDTKLRIPDGFRYALGGRNDLAPAAPIVATGITVYFTADFASDAIDGGTDGMGDGGGDGGDGCGGGCGGD